MAALRGVQQEAGIGNLTKHLLPDRKRIFADLAEVVQAAEGYVAASDRRQTIDGRRPGGWWVAPVAPQPDRSFGVVPLIGIQGVEKWIAKPVVNRLQTRRATVSQVGHLHRGR